MISKNKLICLTSALMLSSGLVYAEEEQAAQKDWSVTVGLKAWANEWVTWGGFGAANAIAPNPSITLKYKDFFVSGGTMLKTGYSLTSTAGVPVSSASREEQDLSVGYYIYPQVAVTLGYKTTTQKYIWTAGGTQDTYKWTIPAIGIAASAPIHDTPMFMYGNFAVGRASLSTSVAAGTTCAGSVCSGGTYTTGELGAGYSFTPSFRLTGGYKFQTIPTETPIAVGSAKKVRQVDTTRGFVLGGSYTF